MNNNGRPIDLVSAALVKAQAAFPPIVKNRTAKISSARGEYSYKYADLPSILDGTRKALTDNGLALTQPIELTEDGRTVLHSMLVHVSGQYFDSYYPLTHYERPQERGSEISYSRRYTASSLLGIASEEDDDGNAAQHSDREVRPYQRRGPKVGAPEGNAPPADEQAPFTYKPPKETETVPAPVLEAPQGDKELPEITQLRETLMLRATRLADALYPDRDERTKETSALLQKHFGTTDPKKYRKGACASWTDMGDELRRRCREKGLDPDKELKAREERMART